MENWWYGASGLLNVAVVHHFRIIVEYRILCSHQHFGKYAYKSVVIEIYIIVRFMRFATCIWAFEALHVSALVIHCTIREPFIFPEVFSVLWSGLSVCTSLTVLRITFTYHSMLWIVCFSLKCSFETWIIIDKLLEVQLLVDAGVPRTGRMFLNKPMHQICEYGYWNNYFSSVTNLGYDFPCAKKSKLSDLLNSLAISFNSPSIESRILTRGIKIFADRCLSIWCHCFSQSGTYYVWPLSATSSFPESSEYSEKDFCVCPGSSDVCTNISTGFLLVLNRLSVPFFTLENIRLSSETLNSTPLNGRLNPGSSVSYPIDSRMFPIFYNSLK